MATTKQLHDFLKNELSEKESKAVKGGKSYVPTNTGSTGYINWDDVDIRNNGLAASPSTGLNSGPVLFTGK